MKNLKKIGKDFIKDESAQGMVEYILIVVAVITLVMILKDKMKTSVNAGLDKVESGISNFPTD